MKIVIDIHERDYQAIVQSGHVPYGLLDAIMRGKILPKGHGRLIDADEFEVVGLQDKSIDFIEGARWMLEKIDNAPTIIEAEESEEE